MKILTTLGVCGLLALGCGDTVERQSLVAQGAALAQNPAASRSRYYNFYACTTCHAVRGTSTGRILPGAPLEGAAMRPSYWNGETLSLREAVERCWVSFMKGLPSDLDGTSGAALEAWLGSIATDAGAQATSPRTYTWPRAITDIETVGDATRGRETYTRACAWCHGAAHTGAGRLSTLVSLIPEDTVREHGGDARPQGVSQEVYLREIVTEKVRHGSFLGYAGAMPPFSTELLSDADLADILEYLGLRRPAM